ncbi:MAG TPA: patatin family protein [Candidatus Cottocaccamicrobium excrementipullorum]|nr:patatin family protein [Candidatus Cottocaccamicrobium excrementipullorum]
MKSAIIDVGGGLRGIYAAGIMDYCMEEKIHFDVGIGVSAGSANIASYTAGQKGRNYLFYTEYSSRKEYMSFGNLVHNGSYIDMDYIYGSLSNKDGENPLDYPAITANPAKFIIVATNALNGDARYFDKSDMAQDNYDIIKASCSIPLVCPPYIVKGTPYYDGALSDPIPVEKAFSMGCDKVVLILTRPKDFRRKPGKDRLIARGIRGKYPMAAVRMEQRAATYNFQLDEAVRLEQEGRLLIIAPDDTCGMDTLTRDRGAMERFYKKGLQDGEAISTYLEEDAG